jgi:hypothetical protein
MVCLKDKQQGDYEFKIPPAHGHRSLERGIDRSEAAKLPLPARPIEMYGMTVFGKLRECD